MCSAGEWRSPNPYTRPATGLQQAGMRILLLQPVLEQDDQQSDQPVQTMSNGTSSRQWELSRRCRLLRMRRCRGCAARWAQRCAQLAADVLWASGLAPSALQQLIRCWCKNAVVVRRVGNVCRLRLPPCDWHAAAR
jgi:hypothetical protein